MNNKTQHVFGLKAIMLCVGVATSMSVRADNPLGLLISETLTYDSNILRNDDQKRSDTTSSTGIKVLMEKDYGRQHYSASVLGVFNRYKNLKDYDNDGYQLHLGLSSELGANGQIALEHDGVRTLQDFGGQGLQRYKETVTSRSTSLEGIYGLYGQWGLSSSLTHDEVKYEERDFQDQSISGVRFGVRYTPSDLLLFDVGVRKSESQRDKYQFFYNDGGGVLVLGTGEKVERTDLNLIARWVVTGYSTLNAQFGFTREKNDLDSVRDFNGFTGRASWNYTPRGKVSYSLAFDRDTNNAGGFTSRDTVIGLFAITNSQKRLSTGIQGVATWAATSKISSSVSLSWRRLEEEQASTQFQKRVVTSGDYKSASIGLKYVPSRNWTFNCNLVKYKRSETLLAVGYAGESFSCNAGYLIN